MAASRLKALVIFSVYLSSSHIYAQEHPGPGAFDPYAGYLRPNGSSCCGGQDCRPAPWDERRGLIGLPDGTWVDPWAVPGAALYYSFDGRAHLCARKAIFCLFVPGSSAALP